MCKLSTKTFIFRFGKFQQQPELWKEIEKLTAALRAEADNEDPENQFLCEMFRHISSGNCILKHIDIDELFIILF